MSQRVRDAGATSCTPTTSTAAGDVLHGGIGYLHAPAQGQRVQARAVAGYCVHWIGRQTIRNTQGDDTNKYMYTSRIRSIRRVTKLNSCET
jgi:hypothetical protein